jgi:hypothetical protein
MNVFQSLTFSKRGKLGLMAGMQPRRPLPKAAWSAATRPLQLIS